MLENGSNFYMPVAPANSNNGFGNGFGGDGWWILLLLLFAGGWGGGFGGGFGGFGNDIYPWMNQANLTSEGFQNQMLNDNVTSIRDGIHELSTQLCNGFANIEQGANARQMADMQQTFNLQSALQNQANYQYDPSVATNDYTPGNVLQAQSASQGTNYAKWLQEMQQLANSGQGGSIQSTLFNAIRNGDLDLNAAYRIMNSIGR